MAEPSAVPPRTRPGRLGRFLTRHRHALALAALGTHLGAVPTEVWEDLARQAEIARLERWYAATSAPVPTAASTSGDGERDGDPAAPVT